MPVIGVAGGIASGKTTVCKLFEKWGATVIDADIIGKQVVEKDPNLLSKLVERFGDDIINHRGILDRRRLGNIVFKDQSARTQLNDMIHPALLSELKKQIGEWLTRNPDTIIIIDAALLLDWDLGSLVDLIIVVKSTSKQRMERLVKHVGLTPEEAENRIFSQSHLDSKSEQADYIMTNNGHITELEHQAEEVWEKIMKNPKLNIQNSKLNIQNSKGLSNEKR